MQDPPLGPRTAAKRQAIIEAATATFLGQGYLGASMDAIAAAAHVSKRTVYDHFGSKENLFTTIILGTVDRILDALFHDVAPDFTGSADLEANLRDLARRYIKLVMQPRVMQLRRLVIGEANRFPDLGRTWYERGPGRLNHTLAQTLARLAAQGRLRPLPDPLRAAYHLSWLILSTAQNEVMFTGDDDRFTAEELECFADEGVRAFLTGYASAAPVGGSLVRRWSVGG